MSGEDDKAGRGRKLLLIAIVVLAGGALLVGAAVVAWFVVIPARREEGTTAGQDQIQPEEAVELSAEGGATLTIPEGAFDDVATVRIVQVSPPTLPLTTTMHALVAPIYELEQDGYADLTRPLTLTIPYDPEALPEDAPTHALTVVWWDGQTWQDVPSAVDTETGVLVAQINHFSIFSVSAARFKALAYDSQGNISPCYFNETYQDRFFSIHYTSRPPQEQEVCTSLSFVSTDDRPDQTDALNTGRPDYIDTIGEGLVRAVTNFDGGGSLAAVTIPQRPTIHIFVFDIEGASGFYTHGTRHIAIDNKFGLYGIAGAVAHELFHYWQYTRLLAATAGKHGWWIEATADWAEDEVFPTVDGYFQPIQSHMPNPARDGLAQLSSRSYSEYYAASTLATFLEARCPGFVGATFDPSTGLSYGQPWYANFERILLDRCSADFSEMMDDYFRSYYHEWGFDADSPVWFGPDDPTPALSDLILLAEPGTYERVSRTLPPLSGRLVTLTAAPALTNANLVVRQTGEGVSPFVYVYGDAITAIGRLPLDLPGSLGREGVLLGAESDQLVVEGYGGAGTGQPVNEVSIVATNRTLRLDNPLELEIYVLEPPLNLRSEDLEADPLTILWTEPELAAGTEPADDGARLGYRLYRQVAAGPPELLADIDLGQTSVEIPHETLEVEEGPVRLFMRTVDKYDNESPDSDQLGGQPGIELISLEAKDGWCWPLDQFQTSRQCLYDLEWTLTYETPERGYILCNHQVVGIYDLTVVVGSKNVTGSDAWISTPQPIGFFQEVPEEYTHTFRCQLLIPNSSGTVVDELEANVVVDPNTFDIRQP